MNSAYFPFAALCIAAGCRPGTDRPQPPRAPVSAPSTATPRPVAQPSARPAASGVPSTQPLSGFAVAEFDRATMPVQVTWDSMVVALRADSGTARADSDYVRFDGAFADDLRAGDRMATDPEFETLFDLSPTPDTALADFLKRHGIPSNAAGLAIADSIKRLLTSRSIYIGVSEGEPYLAMSEKSISKSVGRFLSPAAREYIAMSLAEQSQPTADDAYLKISWDEFGDRIALVARFVSSYPTSMFTTGLRGRRDNDLRLYLRGSEGFDAPVPDVTPEAKANIEYYLAKYGSTPAGAIVRGYRDVLAAQGFRGGKTLDEYLAKLP
jgi:hypothetical protein